MENIDRVLESRLTRFNVSRIFINLALVLFILINVAALAVFVVFLVLFVVNVVRGDFIINYLAFFLGAIIVALINNLWFIQRIIELRRSWRKKFKNFAVPYVFSKTFENATFTPNGGIKKESVINSGIISSGNDYHSEDLVVGNYKGVNFAKADVCLRFKPKRGSSFCTVFMGQWMIFDFNKPINAYVRVFERGLISGKSLLGMMLSGSSLLKGTVGASKGKIDNAEKIAVEDIAFNKKFEITTKDPHTAFYILTPQFIEAVKFLEKEVFGQLMLAFFDNRLHVAINTNHSDFETMLSLSAKLNLEMIEKQVLKITKFVDILRLDNDYFK